MTEDYKKSILDYISGNVVVEAEKNNSFRDNETIINNLTTKLGELGITFAGTSGNIKVVFDDNFSNYLMYGLYISNSKNYTWIAIISENGEVLDILTTYESGMPIEYIQDLQVDENGNMYGVDIPNVSAGETQYYRIILFNNLMVPIRNKYVCKLRASYYIRNNNFKIPTSSYSQIISKVVGEARYYIFGYDNISSPKKTMLIQFSNIVGFPTEWNYYYGTNLTISLIDQSKLIIEPSGETETLDIYYRSLEIVGLCHEYFDGENLIEKTTVLLPNQIFDIAIENGNTAYVASRHNNSIEDPNNHTYTMYVYKIQEDSYEELFNFTQEVDDIPRFYITVKDGIVFCKMETYIDIGIWGIICGTYYNDKFIQSPIYQYQNLETFTYTPCNINKTYNLYTFIVQNVNEIYSPTIVIYDNQYSGESRTNYDTTLPQHAELYSGGYIRFARDLYNRQTYQNQCVSTVNIPYNFLNDISVSPSNLISASMTTLVNNANEFIKNKYENLFINYSNKINVIDEDTSTLYKDTASFINENINTGTQTNCEDTFIGKVRINFTTPQIQNIVWTWNVDHYETNFTIYTSEIPSSIEFISSNEETTYITKVLNVEENKFYTISQKLRIE